MRLRVVCGGRACADVQNLEARQRRQAGATMTSAPIHALNERAAEQSSRGKFFEALR
jgi:hypothetical protein